VGVISYCGHCIVVGVALMWAFICDCVLISVGANCFYWAFPSLGGAFIFSKGAFILCGRIHSRGRFSLACGCFYLVLVFCISP
jgi:hypothetical protein